MAKLHTTPEEREREAQGVKKTVGVYDDKGKKGRSKALTFIVIAILIVLALIIIGRIM